MARNAASKVVRTAALAAAAGLWVTACGVDELGEVGAGGGDGEVPERVAIAFEDSCALASCHDASAATANLVLERGAIDAILNKESATVPGLPLVKLGDVGGSVIARKILDTETLSALYGEERVGMPMPPRNAVGPETPENILIILAWIAGANIPPADGGDGGTDTGGFGDEAWGHGGY